MILKSVADAAKIKAGDQFSVEVDGMDPQGPDETVEAFMERDQKAREERQAIFAAADTKVEADACDARVMKALRKMTVEDAAKALPKADFVAVAKMKKIDHRGKEIEVAQRIKDRMGLDQ